MQETNEIRDKVVLVGLSSPVLKADSADEGSMEELVALVETAGGETEGIVLQNRDKHAAIEENGSLRNSARLPATA